MAKNVRLGRGLDSLISGGVAAKKRATPAKKAPAPEHETDDEFSEGLREIPVSKVVPNPHQPRREFDATELTELADSIRSEGLLQPIVVRVVDGKFELVAGERRLRACQEIGMKRIPARVIEATEASSAVLSLIENLQRSDLNPIEEALGYASLMKDFGLTQDAVSKRIGKARASIANALRLLQLDREIQSYLSKGHLSVGHAKVLLGLDGSEERLHVARQIIERSLSVREAEKLVTEKRTSSNRSPVRRSAPAAESIAVEDLERRLTSALSTPVQLKHTPKKGKIIIEYYGNEDLQRILDQIGVKG